MPRWRYKQFYRRNLPHIHSPGATLFVTFRLANSIPQAVIREYRARKDWLVEELARVEKKADREEITAYHEQLLKFKRIWFQKFEELLHQGKTGLHWLRETQIAEMVTEALRYRDGKVYRLDAYCIMSNHVHAVFAPLLSEQELYAQRQTGWDIEHESVLSAIMQSLKGYTARQANLLLGRTGQFWEHESYDHEVRNEEEFARIVKYILNNPVKAGLVREWKEWPWSYQRERNLVP